ncbi:unnamed protein product [Camellia sinensis]
MADEPSLTRWSFQKTEDFKKFYDVKFGRKKAPEETDAAANGETARVVYNGNSSTVASNGSVNVKNKPELAIYEQYRSQDNGSSTHYNGVSSAGFDEKPRTKGHFARSKGAQLRKHIDATLGSGNLREAVRLPPGEDANEWLAVNTVDFFNQVNLLYGTLTEFCTPENCPTMTAGPKYEYRWADGVQIKKPIEVSAPKYVEYIENRERKMEEKMDVDGQKNLLPAFESAEMRTLAESLSRDIIRGNPDVKWESIKGLENAKQLLKEAVVMPIKYPKYFTGLLSPWKGILLFGPPGTGK